MRFEAKKILFLFLSAVSLQATDLQGFLTKDDIDLFYKQGYLLKTKVSPQNEMAKLNEEVSGVIDRALDAINTSHDLDFSEKDQLLFIDGSRVVCKRRPDLSISIARINGCAGMEPNLIDTLRSEKMVRTFFELLGTNELEHLISQIHPKLPFDQVAFPKHRDIQYRKEFDPDWQDVLGNGSYAVCIIPIDPMNPENGGLWVDKNNYPLDQGLDPELVWISAEPGDLLFMHPHLFHGSGANNSGLSRKTLLTGFCAFGANHKAYPGAQVNSHIKLTAENKIEISEAPWSLNPFLGPSAGH